MFRHGSNKKNVQVLTLDDVCFAYPWVVKGDPVFNPITKSLKAQVGIVIK